SPTMRPIATASPSRWRTWRKAHVPGIAFSACVRDTGVRPEAARSRRYSSTAGGSVWREYPRGTGDMNSLPAGTGIAGHEVHGRLGARHTEGERLLQVEVDLLAVVRVVADRHVLADVELVVASALGDDDRTVDRGCPDHAALMEDPLDVRGDRVALVRGFRELRVQLRGQQQVVGAAHAVQAQSGDRLGDSG